MFRFVGPAKAFELEQSSQTAYNHFMEILYLLIPLGLLVLGVAIWGFLWAVKTGQFDDMEGPAHRILMDDDDIRIPTRNPENSIKTDDSKR